MDKTLVEQIRDAVEADGRTLQQLIDAAALRCGVPSLSKKLRGLVPLRTSEAEAMAATLKIRLSYPCRRKAA